MPRLTPASCITASASPMRSRASSVEKVLPTIGATGRWALGKCGSLGCARHEAIAVKAQSAAPHLLHIFDLDRLAGHALRQSRGHEAVEIAVEHVAWSRRRHSGAQILDQLVRLQDVGADLVAPADVGLGGIGFARGGP